MSCKASPSRRSHGFTFLEVLLVLGIVGMMVLCLIGFVLSKRDAPLKVLPPAPVKATPAPGAATPGPTPALIQ